MVMVVASRSLGVGTDVAREETRFKVELPLVSKQVVQNKEREMMVQKE